jgi:hypothetical protein
MMIHMTETTILVTSADDSRRAMLTFHKPGCAHLRSLQVLQTSEKSIEDLQSWADEAKALGTPNPIAPCLRKEI